VTKRSFLIWALVILVAGLALRAVWLRADPPTTSVGIVWHDEGPWTHNARNKALWGQWVTDQWNPVYVAPVFIALEYAAFRDLGVGTWQARTVPLVSGMLAIAFLMAGLAAAADRRAALLGGALLATNYVFVSWNRAALMESTLTSFVVMAWAAYAMAEKRPGWGLVAGMGTVLAYFTKASAAFFVAAIVLDAATTLALASFGTLRQRLAIAAPDSPTVRAAMLTFAGIAAAGVPILAFFVLPHWNDYFAYNVTMSIERKPSYGWHDLLYRGSLLPLAQNFYTQMWLVVAASAVGLAGIVGRWRTARPAHRLLVLWLLLGLAELVAHDATNSRYQVVLIPAFVALGAMLLATGPSTSPMPGSTSVRAAPSAALWILVAPIVLYLGYVVFASLLQLPFSAQVAASDYKFVVRLSAGLALASSALVLWRWDDVVNWIGTMRVPAAAATVIVTVTVGWNLFEYGRWAQGRSELNYRASIELGGLLPAGTLVQGKLANGLSLENRIRPIFIGNHFGNYDDRFQRDDARYILSYVLPSVGYESDQGSGLIQQILERYPNRRAVEMFDLTEMFDVRFPSGPFRAALFDKFPDRR
jgi:4-amino-4-deoxy-L-arabinose transferase-like glycosyltransferase